MYLYKSIGNILIKTFAFQPKINYLYVLRTFEAYPNPKELLFQKRKFPKLFFNLNDIFSLIFHCYLRFNLKVFEIASIYVTFISKRKREKVKNSGSGVNSIIPNIIYFMARKHQVTWGM